MADKEFINSLDLNDLNEFNEKLSHLSQVINKTSQDAELRKELGSLTDKLISLTTPDIKKCDDVQYLRILRGCILLLRNIVIDSNDVNDDVIISNLMKFQTPIVEMYDKVRICYYEVLANLSHTRFINNLSKIIDKNLPFVMTIFNLVNIDPSWIFEQPEILKFIFSTEFDHMDQTELTIVKVLEKIIVHESFGNWFKTIDDDLIVLQTIQVIVPDRSWDNYELVGLLSWLHPLYTTLAAKTIEALQNEQYDELNNIHPKLIIVVDCLSELGKFNIAKDYMINYNLIDELIPLLGTIHQTIKPKNMMKKIESPITLPHIKSIIIEIISYLAFENFKIQEKVRNLGGLQVILSNCIIDDDNPYIKERSIIALKFLLKDNQENQKLVANLEAKKSVDNEILDQVGYEVEVKDGNIELKKK